MQKIPKTLKKFIAEYEPIKRVLIAYSGGVDSTVLLHAIAGLSLRVPVLVIHVNHQLSGEADSWQRHCEQFAQSLKLPLVAERVTVQNRGRGIEDEARKQRYQAIEKHVVEGDMILCAHHAGDQLETFFLRLMRGAGVAGLAGIKACRPLGAGVLGRPLLHVSKLELLSYAKQFNLLWIEDDSNGSDRFDRNFIRRQVLPSLVDRWPQAEVKINTATTHLAKAHLLLDEYAKEDYQTLVARQERLGSSIQIPESNWSRERVSQLLRYWLNRCDVEPPSAKQLEELLRLIDAEQERQPVLRLGQLEIRRFKMRLYCIPVLTAQARDEVVLFDSSEQAAILPDGSILQLNKVGSHVSPRPPSKVYRVEFRQAGLRCQPLKRRHSQTLKKLLQEYALEPWLRSRVPLIYDGDVLVAVGDLWVEASVAKASSSDASLLGRAPGLEFSWCYPRAVNSNEQR